MAFGGQCQPLTEVLKSDFLTCGICMGVYDHPKILPCLHTYCEKCLASLVASQDSSPVKITCPECRDVSAIPDAGIHGLMTCFFISGLIDLYNTKSERGQLCSLCLETKKTTIPAVAHCIDCADNLCSTCSSGHCCSRLTAHHQVVDLEDLSVGKFDEDLRIRRKMFCSIHSTEELRFYCDSCKIPICRDCRLLSHIEHTCTSISDAVSSIVAAVNDCIGNLENQLYSIVEQRKNLQSKIVQIQDSRNACFAQIDNFTQRIISCLHQESQKAKTDIGEKIDDQEKPLLKKLHEFQTREALVQSTLDFSSNILKNAKETEILNLADMLYARIQRLNSENPTSSAQFSLGHWVLSCRVCPETFLESLFDVQYSQDNHLGRTAPEAVPRTQPPPTPKCNEKSSWTGDKHTEDECRIHHSKPDSPTTISQTMPEPVLYSHVLEISANKETPNWMVEKIVKLKLKDDTEVPCVAGMVVNNEEALFITDISNRKVKIASGTGKFIKTVKELDGEIGLSGLANFGEHVICVSTSRVTKISKEGELVKGNILLPRKTDCNRNIAVYHNEYLAIAEGNLGTVSLYQTTGKLLRRLAIPPSIHNAKPSRPVFVTFNKRGHLLVSDCSRNEVVILDVEGNLLRRFIFGDQCPPCCVCVDKMGLMFLSCFGKKEILCLKDEEDRWTPSFSLGCDVTSIYPIVITTGRHGRLYVSAGDGRLRIYKKT